MSLSARPRRVRLLGAAACSALLLAALIALFAPGTLSAAPGGNGNGNGSSGGCNQSNPDGGAADKPAGGQDCNNGSGNDDDCDDDNNGHGTPQSCKGGAGAAGGSGSGGSGGGSGGSGSGSGASGTGGSSSGGSGSGSGSSGSSGSGGSGGSGSSGSGSSGGSSSGGSGGSGAPAADTVSATAGAGENFVPEAPGAESDPSAVDASPTGIDLAGPPVESDEAPELGEADNTDTPDRTTITPPPAVVAGTDVTVSGSLPFTGASTWIAAALGVAALLLGAIAHLEAARLDRGRIG